MILFKPLESIGKKGKLSDYIYRACVKLVSTSDEANPKKENFRWVYLCMNAKQLLIIKKDGHDVNIIKILSQFKAYMEKFEVFSLNSKYGTDI